MTTRTYDRDYEDYYSESPTFERVSPKGGEA
jgi:hypothetical protein